MYRITRRAIVPVLMAVSAIACSDSPPTTAPLLPADPSFTRAALAATTSPAVVRQLAATRGVIPLPRPPHVRKALAELGQALAFDRVLSGNRDISCTTCHLPTFATGDTRSLSIGQGATGLGPQRTHPHGVFIPRNAPPLFNLSALKHLFWDGRVAMSDAGAFTTPAGAQITPAMTRVFEFGAASALGMFPVTNRAEMRGGSGNELASIPDADLPRIWSALMRRLGGIEEYRDMFERAYPGTRFEDMTFAHASNAIAGFFVDAYSFNDSPWDRFLGGHDNALSPRQLAGAETFLTLKCSLCHIGSTFSDELFHNVAVAQIGPGQGNGPSLSDDFGRMNVTGDPADRYRFRTTPLRNVELTGPYGHDGSVLSLRDFVAHYSESDVKLLKFNPLALESALRTSFLANQADILATRDPIIQGVVLTDELVDKLMDYMSALTDDDARDLRRTIPKRVPSRLPVDRP